jgi:hypothetical protein
VKSVQCCQLYVGGSLIKKKTNYMFFFNQSISCGVLCDFSHNCLDKADKILTLTE